MAPILETAISLVFVFLVFSLINSWIVEYLSMQFQRRGKFLYEFMTHYMDDKFNKNWGLMLYAHPLLEVLHREINTRKGMFSFLRNNKLSTKRRLPAYVPSNQLASAMIDLISKHDVDVLFKKDEKLGKMVFVKPEEMMKPKEKAAMEADRDSFLFNQFLDGLQRLNESEMKTTLVSISRKIDSNASNKVNQLNTHIGMWFDASMERLNGWYKRETRTWLFFTGLAVAVLFNVNTIDVVDRLYTDPQTRDAVVKAAEKYIEENPELVRESPGDNLDSLRSRIDELQNKLARLPFGWGDQLARYPTTNQTWLQLYTTRPASIFIDNVGENWIGWILTALALSFGAPFWFDVLKKFINVRSAGLPPAPTKESEKDNKQK